MSIKSFAYKRLFFPKKPGPLGQDFFCKQEETVMRNKQRFKAVSGLMIAVVILFFSGCATAKKTSDTVTEPFKSKQHINLAPFAEQLATLVGDIQFGLVTKNPIYMLRFMDTPELVEYQDKFQQFRVDAGKILAYSARTITLAQSHMTAPEKVEALADYIDKLRRREKRPENAESAISPEKFDKVLNNVRRQENLLDAMRAAQPLVEEVSRNMRAYIDELDNAQEQAEEALGQRIKAEHKDVLDYSVTLKNRGSDTLQRLQNLHQYRSGDAEALEKVLQNDPELQGIIKKGAAANYKDLKKAENKLTERLELLNTQFKLLSTQLEYYVKQKNELNEFVELSDNALRKAKLAILLWTRVHRLMAAGITDPAKVDVFGLLNKAVGKVL